MTASPPRLRRMVKTAGIERWLARGSDATERLTSRPAVVLAPHPDDETLGCGLTILAKRARGLDVRIVFISDGGASHPTSVIARDELVARRHDEAVAAAAALGLGPDRLTFLDVPDGEVDAHLDLVVNRVGAVVEQAGARELLGPSEVDGHPDHIATARAAARVVAHRGGGVELFEYTIWFWNVFPRLDPSWSARAPRTWVRAARRLRELRPLMVDLPDLAARKAAALSLYRTQNMPLDGGPGARAVLAELFPRRSAAQEVFFEATARAVTC